MKRRAFIESLVAVPLAGGVQGLHAQGTQSTPIRLVVPYSAGGQTDTLARVLAASLEKSLGRTVLVDNRPGAGALVGSRFVQQAKADGSTYLYHNSGLVATALLRNTPPYDPVKDFDPVAVVARGPNFLMVHESVPAKNVAELIAYVKTLPDGIACANSGTNTGGHISALMLQKLAKMKMVHVPYKGSSEVTTALLSGEVKMQVSVSTESLNPHIQSGRIRVLGITSSKRSSLAPNVPAISETVPGYAIDGWFGILGPAGMADEVKQTFANAVNKALSEPEVNSKYRDLFQEPDFHGPAAFKGEVAESVAFYNRIILELGLVKT